MSETPELVVRQQHLIGPNNPYLWLTCEVLFPFSLTLQVQQRVPLWESDIKMAFKFNIGDIVTVAPLQLPMDSRRKSAVNI